MSNIHSEKMGLQNPACFHQQKLLKSTTKQYDLTQNGGHFQPIY